jgi:hypothetical protein
MTNIYISDIVGDDGFYSSASSVYMEMLIIYLVEDPPIYQLKREWFYLG